MKLVLKKSLILVFTFYISLNISVASYSQIDLMEKSPYQEKEIESTEIKEIEVRSKKIFQVELNAINADIQNDKSNFLNYYNRGKLLYNQANYLFNINNFNKKYSDIKANQDKYLKYFESSVEDFEKSIEINSNYFDSYSSLAKSLIKIDKIVNEIFINIDRNFKSLGYIEKLSSKKSLYIIGRKELERIGRIYNQHLKQMNELENTKDVTIKYALETIKKAESISANNPDTYFIYSLYYLNIGDYKKAEEAIKKSLDLDIKNAEYFNTLGVIYFKKKDYKKAEENFKDAILLNRSNNYNYSEFIKNLGFVYTANKNIDKVFQNFNPPLDLDSKNDVLKSNYLYLLSEFLKDKTVRKSNLKKIIDNLSNRKDTSPFKEIMLSIKVISSNLDKNDKITHKNNTKKIRKRRKY